jgi:hypothetical protein
VADKLNVLLAATHSGQPADFRVLLLLLIHDPQAHAMAGLFLPVARTGFRVCKEIVVAQFALCALDGCAMAYAFSRYPFSNLFLRNSSMDWYDDSPCRKWFGARNLMDTGSPAMLVSTIEQGT